MNVLGAFGSAKKVLLSQVCIYTEKKEKNFHRLTFQVIESL